MILADKSTFHKFSMLVISLSFTLFHLFSKNDPRQIERSTSKAISLQFLYCQRVTQTVEDLAHISR